MKPQLFRRLEKENVPGDLTDTEDYSNLKPKSYAKWKAIQVTPI